ncbi:hypothetical protein GGR51DRAFT_573426 [Nemania sp. FL0031]|nr:hypothetical protein GGR51DRAFT_573426 [Nemania sp. FL0031]
MELPQDADLLQAIKLEVSQAVVYSESSSKALDLRKLLSMPLLQSVYAEALRLHVGILITWKSTEPVTIAGCTFPSATVFQAPIQVSHLKEDICGETSMCAGRNVATAEVWLTAAMLVSKFSMKFVEWAKPNGTLSDRPVMDDTKYANAVASPPDREMRVKWQRI